MGQGDIRVKLTPEGVAEVVRALRQVRSEASDANRQTSKLLSEIKGLLPTLGFAAVVTGFGALVKGAAAYADEVGKAALRTGSSAENFSVLAFAAKTADIEFGTLESTLAKFTRSLEGLRDGAAEPTKAFRELNLSAADFEGKDTAEAFVTVSEAMVKLGFSSKTTNASLELLGRGGARLLTLVRDLGEKGFREVAKDAEAAGAIISTDLAASAEAANDSMTSMGIVVQGLALRFVAGLAPHVTTAMTQFRDDVQGKGIQPMQEFGDKAGRAFRVVLAGANLIRVGVAAAFNIVGKSLGGVAAQIEGFLTGGFEGFKRARAAVSEDIDQAVSDATKEIDDARTGLLDALDTKPIEIKVKPKLDTDAIDDTAADAQQQLQQRLATLAKQTGDSELKALEDVAKRRRELAEEAIKVEEARAQAIASANANTTRGQQVQADAESQVLSERVRIITQSFQAEAAVIRQRAELLSAAAQKQFGDTHANEQLQTEIARQATNERLGLAQRHFNDLTRLQVDYINRYRVAQEAIREIDQQTADNKKRFEDIFKDAAFQRLTTEQQAAEVQRQGFEQVRQLRAAVLAGDLKSVNELNAKLLETVRTLANTDGFDNLARQLSDEAQGLFKLSGDLQKQGLEKTAKEAQSATKSLGEQIKEASADVQKLQQALLQGISVKFKSDEASMRQLVDDVQRALDEKPFSIRVAPQLTGSSSTAAFAGGGKIAGVSPHPKADDKLVRVTSGEFIHRVAAVNYYGAQFMDDLNAMRIPRRAFADGGYVDDDDEERKRLRFAVGGLVPMSAASARLVSLPRYADGGPIEIDDLRVGSQVHLRPIPGFASGGLVQSQGHEHVEPTRDEVDVNLNIAGERVRARTERQEARRLTKIFRSVSRGIAGK